MINPFVFLMFIAMRVRMMATSRSRQFQPQILLYPKKFEGLDPMFLFYSLSISSCNDRIHLNIG